MSKNNLVFIIKTIGLFVLISFTVDKIIYFSMNTISDKVFTGKSIGKLNHYLKIKDDLNLIIYGSSRANHNIDPSSIEENSFNMGVDGRKLAYSTTLIKLLPKNKKQTVLLHVDPTNAFDDSYEGKDIIALQCKYNRDSTIRNSMNKLHQANLLQNFYWSLSYNGNSIGIIKNYLKPKYNYAAYNGFDPIKVSGNQKKMFKKILKKQKNTQCRDSFKLNTIFSKLIKETKEFCSQNNKKLILFTSPLYNDDCKNDNLRFANFLKKEKLLYFDLTDFYKKDKSLENWKDQMHLSQEGAISFTDSIKLIVQNLYPYYK